MKAEKIIRLRMQNSTFCRRIPVVQGDTARTFRFILEDITLDGTEHARIYARKPSGAEIYDECDVIGSNEVIFTPETEQIFIETGIIQAEIRVAKGEKLITSYSFEFEVRQSTMRTGDIPSSDEFNVLERAIEEAKGLHEPEFTEAGKRENIVSGETMQILFGKIKKWFTDLGALITKIGNKDISSIGDGTVTGAITDLDKRSTKNTSDIDVERKRIDNIAKLPEGSTAGDAELADIRVAADGTVYDTAGESVRGQINQIDQKYEKETGSLKEDLDDLTEPTKNKFTRDIIVSENGFEFKNNIISNNITDTKSYTAIKLYGKKDNVNVETYATNKELTIGNNVFYFNVKQDIDTLVFLHSGSARDLHFAFDVSKFIKRGYNSFSFTAESVNPSVENGVRLTKVQFENGGQTSYEYPYVSNDSVARREILEINKQILEINKHFENNLLNQKGKFPFKTEIFKNSVSNDNNYGSDNIRYRFTMPKYHKVHGFFEYQFTKAVPYRYDNTNVRLLSIGNNAVTANLYLDRPSVSNGYIYRSGMVLQENSYIGTTSKEFSVFTTNSFKGNDALYVRYIDSGTDVTMKIESGKITFKNGDTTLAVVSYSASDSIDSLIAKLKTLTFIEVGFVETTGKTCSDLLYDVTVPLTYTFDGTIDRPRIYVPYAYDDKWHTVEFIFDKDTMRSYVAFDGLTIESDVSDSAFGKIYDDCISIGGTFELSESPVRLRNLEMDIDSYGDAEIVDSKASPYNAQKQLISSHNPRLLIYEGHGIDVRMDSDAIPSESDDMACSTDRLMRVFEELTRKGYKSVTYEDIVDWKINGKPLPKRCFNLMFDDYRIENYLDDRKRFPFSKYNVKAGLAIISDSKDMSEEVTIDDTTYTVSEAFDAIKNGGWHPCSHTNTHTPIDDIMPSALPQKLKECIVSCNKHNLYSDVIVYPLGKVSTRSLSALENSDFSIGINIVTDRYNCRALPNMNLTRVEIGTRKPIDKVLETIV